MASYSPEISERAVRLVLKHQNEHRSQWAAMVSDFGQDRLAETLRKWMRQAERVQGLRAGTTTAEQNRAKELGREVRELRQANEILREASADSGHDRLH